ncbi:hypothetical protein BDA96_03G339700 [Sorghum bicolor]|uniref:Exonuclease 1 n=4 Tax=Sorghum bicolor TaxID=4558 RepID=A0A1W0VZV3_SORBI|nr:exonuclease 1 isoform X2 [Sorghum bicolor]KAG0539643.1 hypothetical protein BDA96_03G339700 [Sorghum bicolor]OQU87654.1 hypothetical protein SORBI_3003G314900 [Sorghum bicolor]|eukprot:XP_021311246.1 exonuclease 1 isoform X2 [Sorghum bicolor]
MGIQGLLPQLKSIMAPISAEELRGQTVAVDTYSWLHKGALSCGDRLCKGIPTTRHIEYCMHRVNMLRHFGVKPILVFDGGLLPIKSYQETKRARSRKENLERAREHEAAGNSRAAFECYQKAVDITPRIASELIEVLKKEKVDYIVAPYEADAQMTFLSVNKLVDAVITEDSDLIPFGCSRIIFKMDKFGQGVEFQITRLERNRELDFNGFTRQMLLEMCILSGCDYLPSLPGMGVKRAHALIQKLKCHEKVIKHLRYGAVSVPPQYEEDFKKAIWAFKFQRVYDPATEDIIHLSSVPHDLIEDLEFLGPWLPQNIAKGIALGNIDPLTKEPFEIKPECSAPAVHKVCPTREPTAPSNGRKKLDLPVQKNILTNYFCLASLEAKRKFRAPKVTHKQQILNESLPSPQTQGSDTPDSVEDTRLPTDHIQASQCSSEHLSSEPPQNDPISVGSQCSSERFSCEYPLDDSDNISPQCSSLDGGIDTPCKDTSIIDRKVEADYGNENTISTSSCLVGNLSWTSEPFLLPHNVEPSIPVQHHTKSIVASKNNNITVRSSYFKTVNKRVCTDQEDYDVGTGNLSGDQLRKSGMLKRRKLSGIQDFKDETLQPIHSDDSPPVVDEDQDTDDPDDTNTRTERRFGCNVSHVNTYSGIAEKSMDKFAALVSSFRYPGPRASGLRAPLKDVKNTLSVRSILKAPEQGTFRRTANKTGLGPPSKSRYTSDDKKSAASPPDISTFAYRPMKTAASDQGKTTGKATDSTDGPADLGTFAYTSVAPAVCYPDRSKYAGTATRIADTPPDLSTFAYKPVKGAVRNLGGSRFTGTALKATGGAGGPSRSQFK